MSIVRAAIYARKSTDQVGVRDAERSVTRQVDHARAYAAQKGWRVADEHIYVDDGISGAEFAHRPGFVRLMNALKPSPPFHALIMSEESRLGREAIETAYALKQLVTAGVRVWFTLEDRERTLDSPTEKIMLSLTAFADELERESGKPVVTSNQATVWATFRVLGLTVLPHGLLLDRLPPATSDPAVPELARLLHQHLISGFVLHDGGDATTWQTLLSLLGRPPEEVR